MSNIVDIFVPDNEGSSVDKEDDREEVKWVEDEDEDTDLCYMSLDYGRRVSRALIDNAYVHGMTLRNNPDVAMIDRVTSVMQNSK